MNKPEAERAIRALLVALGFDPDSEELRDTPERVARMYEEILSGYQQDDRCLERVFNAGSGDPSVVVLRDIEFYSTCEHHLLPFNGVASVAYLPRDGKVVGLSKLVRIVDVYARRLQLQERLTREIADALETRLDPLGVGVVIEARHGCMACRGVRRPGAALLTSALRGVFRTDGSARMELMGLIQPRAMREP